MNIYKQELSQRTIINKCQTVLSVDAQRNTPVAWFVHDDKAATKIIQLYWTGEGIFHVDLTQGRFLGTIQLDKGAMILHAFEFNAI